MKIAKIVKKNTKPVFSPEQLNEHPLVQTTDLMLQRVKEQEEKFSDYYEHLAQNPDDRSQDNEIQYNIEAALLASKHMTTSLRQTFHMADELDARYRDASKTSNRKLFHRHMTNATIDSFENRERYYAKGMSGNKLRLICAIGSFIGVIIELLWCFVTNGYLESRSGLVWGPFNLLYGIGAVAMTVVLYRFRNRGSWLSFLCGMIVGSAVEYACSWGQELIFGSVSWNYSHLPFNINGRICLPYSICWGILGVLWIKTFYPYLAAWLLKIPNKAGNVISWALTVFLLVNTLISGVAVLRWSQRVNDQAQPGAFWEFIDERFPNERMERIYTNMDFSTGTEQQPE